MKITYIILISTICFILLSCNTHTDKEDTHKVDSLTLVDLHNNYEKTRSRADLDIYLQKIDTMLAKDNNIFTYENIGLAELKLFTLLRDNVDTSNPLLVDSLYEKIFSFYKNMATIYPNNPRVYIDLAKMYNYPQKANVDSVYFYYEKTLLLCDSILQKLPYDEETYRIKIYTLLTLNKREEAKRIIEKDIESTKNNNKIVVFLTELSKEMQLQ